MNNHDPPRRLSTTKFYCRLPNTPLTASSVRGPKILLRNHQTGEHKILFHERSVSTFGVSSCGQWIAAGCENYVHLWHSSSDNKSPTWRRVGAVPNFFERVKAIVWRPQALEFVVCCVDGSARAWRFREELDGLSAHLALSIGLAGFEASGAVIANTVDHGEINRKLLKRYGAIDWSSSSSGLEDQGAPDVLVQSDTEESQPEEEDEDDEGEEDQEGEDEEEEEKDDEEEE